jgi:hypothetical protein
LRISSTRGSSWYRLSSRNCLRNCWEIISRIGLRSWRRIMSWLWPRLRLWLGRLKWRIPNCWRAFFKLNLPKISLHSDFGRHRTNLMS